ncbi:hypothetical protein SBA6_30015 [Candidatus Sulfopaludibacter sp. SbA6]|nr:hypothetical protein SBA6_30015 [Candidatus Sulfopaludibacter sp. SbA6]
MAETQSARRRCDDQPASRCGGARGRGCRSKPAAAAARARESRDRSGYPERLPLHIAVQRRDAAMVRLLMELRRRAQRDLAVPEGYPGSGHGRRTRLRRSRRHHSRTGTEAGEA